MTKILMLLATLAAYEGRASDEADWSLLVVPPLPELAEDDVPLARTLHIEIADAGEDQFELIADDGREGALWYLSPGEYVIRGTCYSIWESTDAFAHLEIRIEHGELGILRCRPGEGGDPILTYEIEKVD